MIRVVIERNAVVSAALLLRKVTPREFVHVWRELN